MAALPEGIEAIAVCRVPFESTDEVELSLTPGDKVLITRLEVGGGWLEGMLQGGDEIGLFPEAYVEIVQRREADPPSAPTPAAPAQGDAAAAAAKRALDATNPFAAMAAATGGDSAPARAPTAPATTNTATTSAPKAAAKADRDSIPWGAGPTILAGSKWKRDSEPYDVQVVKAETMGKKFHGIKQFTVFKVTDTRTNVAVERRFKHFTWLHEQFVRIYPNFIIPPLPEKQLSGRFDDDFVERRRRALERFLTRVATHPVFGSSPVLLHFLTASDQTAWKAGKRLSEQLPPVTGTVVVQGNGEQPNAAAILKKTATFMEWLAKKISGWHDAGEGLSTSFHGLAASFDKMAVALMQFSGPQSGQPEYSEWWDEGRSEGEFAGVLMSLARFGSGVERIASMIREHQEHQSASLLEFLKHYSELTRSLPANLPGFQPPGKGHHGGSVKKSGKEAAKSPATSPTGDVDDAEATQIMMAELRYFHERLVHDLQVLIHNFIQEQIAFHRKAADTWDSLVIDFEGDESSASP